MGEILGLGCTHRPVMLRRDEDWTAMMRASLDPGSVTDRTAGAPGQPSPLAAARARFWLTFDPTVDPAQALAGTTHQGALPSPVEFS